MAALPQEESSHNLSSSMLRAGSMPPVAATTVDVARCVDDGRIECVTAVVFLALIVCSWSRAQTWYLLSCSSRLDCLSKDTRPVFLGPASQRNKVLQV
jgi:hypothetical protein